LLLERTAGLARVQLMAREQHASAQLKVLAVLYEAATS
jgi:hypothetical protein